MIREAIQFGGERHTTERRVRGSAPGVHALQSPRRARLRAHVGGLGCAVQVPLEVLEA